MILPWLGCAASVSQGPAFEDQATETAAADAKTSEGAVRVLRSTEYQDGSVYVLDVNGAQVTYECGGNTCQRACTYDAVPTRFEGAGQQLGDYAERLRKRAATEFACAPESVKQMGHHDKKGGGMYVMHVCGNRVKYACEGKACHLVCD